MVENFTINKTLKSNLPDTVEGNQLHFTEYGEIYINNKDDKLVRTGVDNDLTNKINVLNEEIVIEKTFTTVVDKEWVEEKISNIDKCTVVLGNLEW